MGTAFTEPTFGTSVTRLTDSERDVEQFTEPELGEGVPLRVVFDFERHPYSQHQAFNADETMIVLNADGYLVRKISDRSIVHQFPGFGAADPADVIDAPRWDPANPEWLIHFNNAISSPPEVDYDVEPVIIQRTNVVTKEVDTIVDLSQAPYDFYWAGGGRSRSFEELSRDGRWLTAFVRKGADLDGPLYFVSYDLQNDTVGLQMQMDDLDPNNADCESYEGAINWVAPSPLGKYMIIQWNLSGETRCSGVEAYEMTSGAYMGHVGVTPSHSDLGLDHMGREIYVTNYVAVGDEGAGSGVLTAILLPGVPELNPVVEGEVNTAAGMTTLLDSIGDFHVTHLSCKGPQGLCVITADYDEFFFDAPGSEPFDNEIYYVKTSGTAVVGDNSNAEVGRLAHHNSTFCVEPDMNKPFAEQLNYDYEYNYRAQPQASISPTGKYVVFASNWSDCDSGADDYLITLR